MAGELGKYCRPQSIPISLKVMFKKIIRALVGPVSMLLAALVLMSDFAGKSTGGMPRFFIAGIIIFIGFLCGSLNFFRFGKCIQNPLKEIANMLKKYE